jgi:hypothetical protein
MFLACYHRFVGDVFKCPASFSGAQHLLQDISVECRNRQWIKHLTAGKVSHVCNIFALWVEIEARPLQIRSPCRVSQEGRGLQLGCVHPNCVRRQRQVSVSIESWGVKRHGLCTAEYAPGEVSCCPMIRRPPLQAPHGLYITVSGPYVLWGIYTRSSIPEHDVSREIMTSVFKAHGITPEAASANQKTGRTNNGNGYSQETANTFKQSKRCPTPHVPLAFGH